MDIDKEILENINIDINKEILDIEMIRIWHIEQGKITSQEGRVS